MTAQTEPQALPETDEDEDDADRRAKGIMAHHLEYGPLAMQRTIAETIRSAVEAERQRAAGLVHDGLDGIKGNPAEMVFYGIALMIENGSDPTAIRGRVDS